MAAWRTASVGKEFSQIEDFLYSYYDALENLKKRLSLETSGSPKSLEEMAKEAEEIRNFKEVREMLGQHFSDGVSNAIDTRDSKFIFELAKAVDFLKTFTPSPDRIRYIILTHKNGLDKNGKTMPIARLAWLIGLKGRDALRQLRRICKELNFPLERTNKDKTPP